MKVAEQLTNLRGQSVDDLRQRSRELDDQVFRLRLQRSMGQAESGNKIRPLRRERARLMTVLHEKGVKD
jgi:large subunit ribosomal protein L29